MERRKYETSIIPLWSMLVCVHLLFGMYVLLGPCACSQVCVCVEYLALLLAAL